MNEEETTSEFLEEKKKKWMEKDTEIHGDTGEVAVGKYVTDGKLPLRLFPKCFICGEPLARDDAVVEVREQYILDSVGHHYHKDKHIGYAHKKCTEEPLKDEEERNQSRGC